MILLIGVIILYIIFWAGGVSYSFLDSYLIYCIYISISMLFTFSIMIFNLVVVKNILVYVSFSENELKQRKIVKLENWFDSYFDKMLTQSLWQTNFVISPDPFFMKNDGQPMTYTNLEELKIKAESGQVKNITRQRLF